MRDLIARTLARQTDHYQVLAAVGTAADAITACKQFQPDLLILDINLPDRSGIDALTDLQRVAPGMRILLCTAFPTDDRIVDLTKTGAHGFVEKTNTWDEFLQAVDRVSRGKYYFSLREAVPRRGVQELPATDRRTVQPYLTDRQREVAVLIADGFTSKEIAAKLHISVATVDTHRSNVMKTIGVRNAAGIASYAFRTGLVKANRS
jgi:DNA-binding NarL/FixJ family response regulator